VFKGCTKYHYNHFILNTFYPTKTDFRRDIRYFFFTFNGAYTIPLPTQRQKLGGTDSIPPTTGL
jgi:hypothetical protein